MTDNAKKCTIDILKNSLTDPEHYKMLRLSPGLFQNFNPLRSYKNTKLVPIQILISSFATKLHYFFEFLTHYAKQYVFLYFCVLLYSIIFMQLKLHVLQPHIYQRPTSFFFKCLYFWIEYSLLAISFFCFVFFRTLYFQALPLLQSSTSIRILDQLIKQMIIKW